MYHSGQSDCNQMSKRLHVTLSDTFFHRLERWAELEGRPVANLAAFILQKEIEAADKEGRIPLEADRPMLPKDKETK